MGINWKVYSDEFTFDVHLPKRSFTKKDIVSTVVSLLGFAGPVILEAKAVLQQLCEQKIDWDILLKRRRCKVGDIGGETSSPLTT